MAPLLEWRPARANIPFFFAKFQLTLYPTSRRTMGIFSKPRLRNNDRRDDMPEGQWIKCPECGAMIHVLQLEENLYVCPHCGHHFLIDARKRITLLADANSFDEIDAGLISANPLNFQGYDAKIASMREKTQLDDALVSGRLTIHGNPAVIAVMDFKFFAGSMGSVVGEKITRAIELAIAERRGVVIVSASSGARMQEGMLSLMQMAKTCAALARLGQAKLPYISLMTHPTTGGVTASFATIGDVNLAEPKCMIGFAGPRVVKETTHQSLPAGFQTAEFMLDHGLVDAIVPRCELRERIGRLLSLMMPTK